MTYRGDFLLGTILRFLPMVTTILLWQAIYAGSGQTRSAGRCQFRYREMIAYLLLTNISRMFSSMPGLAGGIAREIREGTMKRYLVQPIDMIGYLLVYRMAHKVTYIVMSFIPYALLFFLCRDFLRRVSRRSYAGGLRHFARPVVPGRVLLRGECRDGGVLVSRSHVAAVYRHDLELLHLRAHVAARLASRSRGPACSRLCRFSTWLISRPSSSWARSRDDAGQVLAGRAVLGGLLHGPRASPLSAGLAAVQRLRRLKPCRRRNARKVLSPAGQPGAVHPESRAGLPGNFLVKVSVEVLWLAILVAFFRTVFARTSTIAGWNEPQYFFFVGCFFAMNGLIEMLFLDNCNEFAELVRTGDLDGLLLKPIDEQFLITCRRIDWGTAPNILMGAA